MAREAGQVHAPPCSAQLAVAAAASRDEAAARAMSVKARLISMSSSFLSSSLLTKTCSLAEPSTWLVLGFGLGFRVRVRVS